jgi:DNA polymerase elongation subunit (family B)
MYRQKLINGEVAVGNLIMTRHLSKNPKHYKQHVSQLIAAEQLIKQGADIHAGNNVTFLFTDSKNKRFNRRVIAEELMENGANPDIRKYLLMLYASAETLLSVKGYTAKSICDAVNGYSANALSKYMR